MEKFELYDTVISKHSLENVPAGALGAVLMVFDDNIHYEVEFIDKEGNTLNVLSVKAADIEKVQ
jgi:hypothetical protein